jgi:hypothetical protein
MFKGNTMNVGALPERVYSICKFVEKEPMTEKDAKELMEPKFLGQSSDYFNASLKAAIELGLVTEDDDMISLIVDPSVIKSLETMREFITNNIGTLSDGSFYKTTKAYFGLSDQIFTLNKKLQDLSSELNKISGEKVDNQKLLAMRFWVQYLGLGYIYDSFFIPNCAVFLGDLIKSANFEVDKLYSISDFFSILNASVLITDLDYIRKSMNYGLTCGLRTLESQGIITLEHVQDMQDIWTLFNLSGVSSTVTNIRVRR